MKYLRYALATFCVAASVGCLALWWRSEVVDMRFVGAAYYSPGQRLSIELFEGKALVTRSFVKSNPYPKWVRFPRRSQEARESLHSFLNSRGHFSATASGFNFPLWYPALIFALVGVGVLRFRRQFSIRSALICVSVVAVLLGMVVAL